MTTERDEPAFPIRGAAADHQATGLTIRDYFAAKALSQAWAAELADLQYYNAEVSDRYVSEQQVAKRAYRMADAMLAARSAQ